MFSQFCFLFFLLCVQKVNKSQASCEFYCLRIFNSRWERFIYIVDNKKSLLHTPKNKGHEGMAYLTYIIENYESLAGIVAFVHSHRDAWHTGDQDMSNPEALKLLRRSFVRQQGYVNLRCRWNPGCPSGVQIHQEKSKELSSYEAVFEDSWKLIFQNSDVPEVVGSGCCAQFAVSKQRIRARSHGFYVHLRKWLLNTNLDDATSGRVMEYLWHIIFGAPAVK